MKDQQIIILPGYDSASDMQNKVNDEILSGWRVVSVTAQIVSTGYTGGTVPARGGFLIVMERER